MIAPKSLDLSRPRRLHLLGAGGSGMAPFARLLLAAGHRLSGADARRSPALDALQRAGMALKTPHALPNAVEGVIHSAAIPADDPALVTARTRDIPVLKYSRALGLFTAQHRVCAVAGTHGKTTTAGLFAYALRRAGCGPSYLVGGASPQLGVGAALGPGDLFVAEACEFDRSFLCFQPELAIVTNVEADHLDYYKDIVEIVAAFRMFATQVSGHLVIHEDLKETIGRAGGVRARVVTYGFSPSADVHLDPGMRRGGVTPFRAVGREFELALPGRHNLLNAGAVLAAAHALGCDLGAVGAAFSEFRGIRRRLELRGRPRGVPVIDDYAHHPTEVTAGLQALRDEFAPRRIWCVFQPHQHSRTSHFLREFAHALVGADRVVIPDIYAARESGTDCGRIASRDLVREVRALGGDAVHITDFDSIVDFMSAQVRPGDLVVTMGAGDVGDVAGRLAEAL